jgi:hypothetical protein
MRPQLAQILQQIVRVASALSNQLIRRHRQWRATTAFGHRVFTDQHLSRQTLIARTSNSWQGFTLGTEVCHLANDTQLDPGVDR